MHTSYPEAIDSRKQFLARGEDHIVRSKALDAKMSNSRHRLLRAVEVREPVTQEPFRCFTQKVFGRSEAVRPHAPIAAIAWFLPPLHFFSDIGSGMCSSKSTHASVVPPSRDGEGPDFVARNQTPVARTHAACHFYLLFHVLHSVGISTSLRDQVVHLVFTR